jgi:hypothetical protein
MPSEYKWRCNSCSVLIIEKTRDSWTETKKHLLTCKGEGFHLES